MSKELTIERLRELADADEHDGDWELEVVLNADEILKHALVGMAMKEIPLLVNPMMPEDVCQCGEPMEDHIGLHNHVASAVPQRPTPPQIKILHGGRGLESG